MLNSTHYLFDSFDINKPSISKETFMKKFNYSALVRIVCIVFAMIGSNSHAQSKKFTWSNGTVTNDSPVVDSRVAPSSLLHKLSVHELSDAQESNDINSIPQAYGFDDEHEFSSRWPQLLDESQEELENLFNLCQVDCAERFKALLIHYDFNDLTIAKVIERFESHQLLIAQCKELWNVLSQIQEKSNINGLMSEISKKLTKEDAQFVEKILKMTKDEFLHMAFRDSHGTTIIVKKIDKLNQSL